MRADLERLARERQIGPAKLLRQLIARELAGTLDRASEGFDQLLFVALGVEPLLRAHPDGELYPTIVAVWRSLLAEEARRYAA